jgi:antitoxin component of MazEF toxin-antitoxin module
MKKQTKSKHLRSLRKSGNSLVVTIPSKIIKKINMSENDIFIIYEESNKIILERVENNE